MARWSVRTQAAASGLLKWEFGPCSAPCLGLMFGPMFGSVFGRRVGSQVSIAGLAPRFGPQVQAPGLAQCLGQCLGLYLGRCFGPRFGFQVWSPIFPLMCRALGHCGSQVPCNRATAVAQRLLTIALLLCATTRARVPRARQADGFQGP